MITNQVIPKINACGVLTLIAICIPMYSHTRPCDTISFCKFLDLCMSTLMAFMSPLHESRIFSFTSSCTPVWSSRDLANISCKKTKLHFYRFLAYISSVRTRTSWEYPLDMLAFTSLACPCPHKFFYKDLFITSGILINIEN